MQSSATPVEHGAADLRSAPGKTYSGMGIASFAVSIAAAAAMFVLLAIAGYIEVTTPGGMQEESPAAVLIGLSMIGLWLVDLVAIGLGIAALAQKDRARIFPVLGIVFAGGTIVGTIVLSVIGNSM